MKSLTKFFDYIKTTDFSRMEDGKYPIEGGAILNLSSYETKNPEDKKAEAHKKYIDIQYVVSGQEMIGVSSENPGNELLQDYNEEKDCTFYKKIANEHFLAMRQGMFAVFFPGDIHRPGCILHEKSDVRKVVIKVPVNKI